MGIELKQVSHIEASTDAFSKPIGLDDFQHEISKKMKNVKFKERDTKTLWAYREGDNYAMGYIGFGDFRDNSYEEEHLYTVWSPNVVFFLHALQGWSGREPRFLRPSVRPSVPRAAGQPSPRSPKTSKHVKTFQTV